MGFKVEGIVNFCLNVSGFFLTSGSRRWYVIGAYMPPNDAPAVHSTEQDLDEAPKGMEVIIFGDLNVRLREPQDDREDDITSALEGNGIGDVKSISRRGGGIEGRGAGRDR